jgi:hypothetical protein
MAGKKEGVVNPAPLFKYLSSIYNYHKHMIITKIRILKNKAEASFNYLCIGFFRVLRLQLLFAKTYRIQEGWQL